MMRWLTPWRRWPMTARTVRAHSRRLKTRLTLEILRVAESGPFLYADHGAAGRRRVRGKDCVHLEVSDKLLLR
jgi:hypothetical protein